MGDLKRLIAWQQADAFVTHIRIIPQQKHEDLARRTDHVAALCYGLTRLPPEDPESEK